MKSFIKILWCGGGGCACDFSQKCCPMQLRWYKCAPISFFVTSGVQVEKIPMWSFENLEILVQNSLMGNRRFFSSLDFQNSLMGNRRFFSSLDFLSCIGWFDCSPSTRVRELGLDRRETRCSVTRGKSYQTMNVFNKKISGERSQISRYRWTSQLYS